MQADTNTIVVVPAFNEGSRILTVISKLQSLGYAVVCVDDGSSDDTYTNIAESGAVAIRHCVNLGQGAALATGFAYAETKNYDYVVTFDADDQHETADISGAINLLRDSNADIVLGSRFIGKTENMPLLRSIILRLAVVFTRITSGLTVSDTHNGFRVLRSSVLPLFRLTQNRMAHASEFHDIIRRNNLHFVEYPNTIRYTDDTLEKGQRLSGAFAILSDLAFGKLYK